MAYADWLEERPSESMMCSVCGGEGTGIDWGRRWTREACCVCGGHKTIPDTRNTRRAELIRLQCKLANEGRFYDPKCVRTEKDHLRDELQKSPHAIATDWAAGRVRIPACPRCWMAEHARERELVTTDLVYIPIDDATADMREWTARLQNDATTGVFWMRGFIASLRCPWKWWEHDGDEILDTEWVPVVKLTTMPGEFEGRGWGLRLNDNYRRLRVAGKDVEIAEGAPTETAVQARWPGIEFKFPMRYAEPGEVYVPDDRWVFRPGEVVHADAQGRAVPAHVDPRSSERLGVAMVPEGDLPSNHVRVSLFPTGQRTSIEIAPRPGDDDETGRVEIAPPRLPTTGWAIEFGRDFTPPDSNGGVLFPRSTVPNTTIRITLPESIRGIVTGHVFGPVTATDGFGRTYTVHRAVLRHIYVDSPQRDSFRYVADVQQNPEMVPST